MLFPFFGKKDKLVIRHRQDHCLSRKLISHDALRVLYRLSDSGYKAYLVGGGVRDILLGRQPKDFDVGTDAQPREIKRLFSHCFLVGKRFRLAHVVFGQNVIETSTFRRQPPPDDNIGDGGLYQAEDNTFGTPEEDAKRRDFTVNGLFYDIKTFDLIDYVGGLRDLDRRILRSIGDPDRRFKEDPVRMMRAIRLSCKLGLTIERNTLKAIYRNYREIEKASPPRVLEEIFRMFAFSAAEKSFRLLWDTGLMSILMPHLDRFIDDNGGKKCAVWKCLAKFDELTEGRGEDVSNGLRVAAIYLPMFQSKIESAKTHANRIRRLDIADETIVTLNERYKLPKSIRFHAMHLLEELTCFEKKPPRTHVVRPARAEQLKDAIVLARIFAAVYGTIQEENIDAWSKFKIAAGFHGEGREDGRNRPPRDGERPRKAGQGADAPAAAEGAASSDDEGRTDAAADDGQDGEDAEGKDEPGAPRRRRRRGRRGRRGRKNPKEAGAPDSDSAGNPAPDAE